MLIWNVYVQQYMLYILMLYTFLPLKTHKKKTSFHIIIIRHKYMPTLLPRKGITRPFKSPPILSHSNMRYDSDHNHRHICSLLYVSYMLDMASAALLLMTFSIIQGRTPFFNVLKLLLISIYYYGELYLVVIFVVSIFIQRIRYITGI